MARIEKFQFHRSFDSDGAEITAAAVPAAVPETPPEPEVPPEPTFTLGELQEQLDAVRRDTRAKAYEEGRAAGRDQAETEAQKALTEALVRLDATLRGVIAADQAAREERRENTVRIAVAIVQRMLPTWMKRHGLAEVEATVAQVLGELAGEPKLTLRLHQDMFGPVRDRIATLAARHGFAGTLNMVPDPDCAPTDCFASWGEGGIERDANRMWEEIHRITGNLLGDVDIRLQAPPAPAAPHSPTPQ
jgi:flagellar assembly protein FliH